MVGGNKYIATLALIVLYLPAPVFAFSLSGNMNGPLLTVIAEGLLLFIFVLFLYGIDASAKGKFTLFIIYVACLFIVWLLTAQLPFYQNANLILSLHFGTPACIWIIGYIALKNSHPYR